MPNAGDRLNEAFTKPFNKKQDVCYPPVEADSWSYSKEPQLMDGVANYDAGDQKQSPMPNRPNSLDMGKVSSRG